MGGGPPVVSTLEVTRLIHIYFKWVPSVGVGWMSDGSTQPSCVCVRLQISAGQRIVAWMSTAHCVCLHSQSQLGCGLGQWWIRVYECVICLLGWVAPQGWTVGVRVSVCLKTGVLVPGFCCCIRLEKVESVVFMTLFIISLSSNIPQLMCQNNGSECVQCACPLCICFICALTDPELPSSGFPAIHLSAVICKGLFNCDRCRPVKPLSCTLFA